MLPRKSCRAALYLWTLIFSLSTLIPCLSATAEQGAPEPPPASPRTVLKAVKYADVSAIKPLVELVEVRAEVEPVTKQIVIRGPEAHIDTAIKLIDALDTPEPPWGIELRVHLVTASMEETDGSGVPDGMDRALDELTDLFGYRGFKLIDTILLFASTAEGGAQVSAPAHDGVIFQVGFDRATVVYGEPKHHVLFENLSVTAAAEQMNLRTNVKVLEEHMVLIGKSRLRGQDKDLVLAVEARLKSTWPRDGDGG